MAFTHRLGLLLALLTVAIASLGVALTIRVRGDDASAAGTNVAFAPATTTLTLGATPVPTVDVTVANVSNLGGYEAWIGFNGAVVQLTGLSDTGFLANPNPMGTPQNTYVCDTPTITATYGHIACSIVAFPSPFPPPVPPSAGASVPLVHAFFGLVGAGTSPLSLTVVAAGTPQTTTLLDVNATPLPATLGSGSITVSGAASVGGIAEAPDPAWSSLRTASPLGRAPYVLAIVAGMAVAVSVGAAIWGLRRRRM